MTTITSRTFFLIDGAGALFSCFMLGFVLAKTTCSGMPVHLLYWLAGLAGIFSVFSLWNYLNFQDSGNWQLRMRVIAFANLLYCWLTFGLLVWHYDLITTCGYLYFLTEIAIIAVLAWTEIKEAKKEWDFLNFKKAELPE